MNHPDHADFLVLHVDDSEIQRYLTGKLLANAGFRVEAARDGVEALERVALDPVPDLVILDVTTPGLDGFEVCARIRADPRTAGVKILHTPATCVTVEERVRGLEVGADAYLTQPIEPEELVATCRALLRLKSAEEELRRRADRLVEADRRKDEFLAMLAHELRNPLAAITAVIPLLERAAPRTPIERRSMQVLRRQSSHLARLVDDLLDVSRVTQGRVQLVPRQLDLAALLRDVVEGQVARAATAQRTLEVDVPDLPVPIEGDPGRIEQIVTNLVENGLKYTEHGGHVRVSLTFEGRAAVIEVTDDGIGIDPELVPSIFGLFSQAHQSIDRSRGGLGIGLTLVKTLVEVHGGAVEAASEGLGRGATFRVRLPLSARELGQAASAPVDPAFSGPGLRLLIVEDNDDARLALRDLCEIWGHRVSVACDGFDGVEAIASQRPDVALVDIGLPGIDGYEVARQARERLGDAPVRLIALTGYGAPDQVRRALEAGFDLHLIKPVDPERLERILADALGGQRLAQPATSPRT